MSSFSQLGTYMIDKVLTGRVKPAYTQGCEYNINLINWSTSYKWKFQKKGLVYICIYDTFVKYGCNIYHKISQPTSQNLSNGIRYSKHNIFTGFNVTHSLIPSIKDEHSEFTLIKYIPYPHMKCLCEYFGNNGCEMARLNFIDLVRQEYSWHITRKVNAISNASRSVSNWYVDGLVIYRWE